MGVARHPDRTPPTPTGNDVILSYYIIGQCMSKMGDSSEQVAKFFQTGLDLAKLYSGADRQTLIQAFNEALMSRGP